ncbi:MAG: hypothetical protein V7647_1206 [Acidobacteriota bacterium]
MTPDGPLRPASPMTRIGFGAMVSIVAALLAAGYMVGKASGPDEATLTVQVSSADHEMEEGYFSLGDSATVMAKPGTDLYRFLARKRGHAVRITLSDAARPAPSPLER